MVLEFTSQLDQVQIRFKITEYSGMSPSDDMQTDLSLINEVW